MASRVKSAHATAGAPDERLQSVHAHNALRMGSLLIE
jgi:hypothetical protein